MGVQAMTTTAEEIRDLVKRLRDPDRYISTHIRDTMDEAADAL